MQHTVLFVLGLKGAMSEAELHVLRARLRGGILNKAQRAALKLQLPVGLVYAEDESVRLDPDAQVQQALQVLFATFKRTGSAWATVKYFREHQLLFPHRIRDFPTCRNDPLVCPDTQWRAENSAESALCWGVLLWTNPYEQRAGWLPPC